MAKTIKAKKVTVTNIIKFKSDTVSEIDWNGININVKNTIGAGEMYKLIEDVVSACFDSDGEYHPEAKEFAVKLGIIAAYTDIDIGKDVSKQYDMCFRTNVFDAVIQIISDVQISSILNSIEDKIDYISESEIRYMCSVVKNASMRIAGIIEYLSELINGIDSERINSIAERLGEIDEEQLMKTYVEKKYGTENT